MLQELKVGQEPRRSHLLAAELRGAGLPRGVAGPAAPRFGWVLKARNFDSRAEAESSYLRWTPRQERGRNRRCLKKYYIVALFSFTSWFR